MDSTRGLKTVFAAVGGKLDLLTLALDWAVAGDDEPVPLEHRLLATGDQSRGRPV